MKRNDMATGPEAAQAVCILLATYNGERFLAEQLDSLMKQTYQNWKVLIHDDCSTDKTPEIIARYAKRYPDNIELLDDKKCCGGARNNFAHLLEHARGEYIMFCDQDDVWKPDKIELTMKKMAELDQTFPDEALLVHTDLEVADEQLHIINNSLWHFQNLIPQQRSLNNLLIQNNITGCSVMINRKLVRFSLPIPEGAMMHDWWIALVAASFGKIAYVDKATLLYRQHINNDTGAEKYAVKEFVHKAVSKYRRPVLATILSEHSRQASTFLSVYHDRLSYGDIRMLECFGKLSQLSWMVQRVCFVKHKIFGFGIVKNISLFLRG